MPRRPPGRSAQELEALLDAERGRVAALERQQEATAEVLRAISRATGDSRPILERIAATAGRLCGGLSGAVYLATPTALRFSAWWVVEQDQAAVGRVRGRYATATIGVETSLDEPTLHNRAFHTARTVYVPDLAGVP